MSLLFFLAYSRTSLFTIITTRHILNNCKSYYNRHFSHVFPYRSKLTLNHTTHFHIYHYSNRSSHSIDALHSFNVVPSYTRSSPSKTSDFIHTRTSSSAHAHIPILATPPGPPFVRLHRNFLQFKPTLLPNNRYFLQLLFVVSLKLRIPALLRSPLLLIIIKVRLIPSYLLSAQNFSL